MFKRNSRNSEDNIFKQISHRCDKESYMINCQCSQDCYCDKRGDNIVRLCFNPNIYLHESFIYLSLLLKDCKITSLMSIVNNEITYHVKNFISLRNYLCKHIDNTTLIINELFMFINSFKNYDFIHGNLHIDNIFVDELKSSNTKIIFCVVDLCNSYFTNELNKIKNYKRTSFLGEYDFKKNILYFWDFCSLFISLSIFFNDFQKSKHKNYIEYVRLTIISYIGQQKFEAFTTDYNKFLNTEHYNKIKIKYHSI